MGTKFKKFLQIYTVAVLGVVLYPPIQVCNVAGACISSGHGMLFDLPFLSTIDYSKLVLYCVAMLLISIIITLFLPTSRKTSSSHNSNHEDQVFEALKPTLLRISEDVAMFRSHGMNINDALQIIKESNQVLPKESHPYILSTVNHVYQLPMSDVHELAKKSTLKG